MSSADGNLTLDTVNVANGGDDDATIDGSTFSQNTASEDGGAGDLVNWNFVDNCEPLGTITNCFG